MNRLHKKCLLTSAAAHGLLGLILLFGPAFGGRSKKSENLPILHLIPSKLVDEEVFGGGQPDAAPPPPPEERLALKPSEPQPPQTKQAPAPPAEKPPPKRVVETAPAEKPDKTAKPRKDPEKPKPDETQKHQVKPNLDLTRRSNSKSASKPSSTRAARQLAQAQQRRQFQETYRSLNEKLSKATTIGTPGPGGEAYASYRQAVMSIYDRAWFPPSDISDDSATVEVEVIIHRDGRVISDRMIKRSGIPALDESVKRTLERVRFVAPFPEGASDEQRTFEIHFNLKTKSLLG